MVVLVCGGREYSNYERLSDVLEEVAGWSANGITIVEGGARGADALAKRWALENGATHVQVPANWKAYGRAAGPIRNKKMLEEWKPDQGVVFPGGAGTLDMLTRLFKARINTWVVSD
jgi:predicted Rossmann fold nucleotide-binding protein DprA/Smf involved in DNA uptake